MRCLSFFLPPSPPNGSLSRFLRRPDFFFGVERPRDDIASGNADAAEGSDEGHGDDARDDACDDAGDEQSEGHGDDARDDAGDEQREVEGDENGDTVAVDEGEVERGRFEANEDKAETCFGVTSSVGRTARFWASLDGDISITLLLRLFC